MTETGPDGRPLASAAAVEQRISYKRQITEAVDRMVALYAEAAGEADPERSKLLRADAHRAFVKAKGVAVMVARSKGERDGGVPAAPVIIPVQSEAEQIRALRDEVAYRLVEDCMRPARDEAEQVEGRMRALAARGTAQAGKALLRAIMRERRAAGEEAPTGEQAGEGGAQEGA